MPHFYKNSAGQPIDIETMHSAHLKAAAAKLRREGGDETLAQAMDETAHKKERAWYDNEPDAFSAWAAKVSHEKVLDFLDRHGLAK